MMATVKVNLNLSEETSDKLKELCEAFGTDVVYSKLGDIATELTVLLVGNLEADKLRAHTVTHEPPQEDMDRAYTDLINQLYAEYKAKPVN